MIKFHFVLVNGISGISRSKYKLLLWKFSRSHPLCGYIACAKSPSCGTERVKVYPQIAITVAKQERAYLFANSCAIFHGFR